MSTFNLARTTIRAAFRMLESEGSSSCVAALAAARDCARLLAKTVIDVMS